jgi:hypothetical protein
VGEEAESRLQKNSRNSYLAQQASSCSTKHKHGGIKSTREGKPRANSRDYKLKKISTDTESRKFDGKLRNLV